MSINVLISLAAFLMLWHPISMAEPQKTLPQEIYFSNGWCPSDEALTEMSRYLTLTMNGCCIHKGVPTSEAIANPDILKQWKRHVWTNEVPSSRCVGKRLTKEEKEENEQAVQEARADEQRREKHEQYREKIKQRTAEVEKEQRSVEEEQRKIEEEQRKEQRKGEEKQRMVEQEQRNRNAPAVLLKLSKNDFCVVFGKSLRGERSVVGNSKVVAALMETEANRRELSLDSNLIRSKTLRMGISECELYASWGHPSSRNRTVGSWGVHIQHVYGDFGNYVYTENGRVTSWQN